MAPLADRAAEQAQFPLSAVVGADDLKLALSLNACDPLIGGVLLRGQKGSAKTTLARGIASLLPGDAPFVELPVGATEDRLVGTIDLAAALTGGERRFSPGLLAAAHGGVLYVDEVNLLPDHLVDVLLDVAASGVNRVEREGVAQAHPSRFVLVGSMNPEEGDLRPQLLDRFGLAVDVTASTDPAERAEAVRRRLAFDRDPSRFAERWAEAEDALRARLAAAVPARLPDELVQTVSGLCAAVGAEGLRADLTICRAASALAGFEDRPEVSVDDVRRVAPLALAHRRRRSPFEEPGIDPSEVDEALDRAAGAGDGDGGEPSSDEPSSSEPPSDGPGTGPADDHEPGTGDGSAGSGGSSGEATERVAVPDRASPVVPLRATGGGQAAGRRSQAEGARGRMVGDRVPQGPVRSVAVGATVRESAVRRAGGDASGSPALTTDDLREAVRVQKVGNLVVLAVDASGSMGAERRMETAKGAVLGLLLDAYQRRDRVALVTFRDDRAQVVLRPTGSVEVAKARLTDLATGGRTPLAAGIDTALEVATAAGSSAGAALRPLLVLVSDGRATAGPPGLDPVEAADRAAAAVRARRVDAVVVDVETGPTRLGLARQLAERMGARHLTLAELTGTALTGAVRSVLP